MKLNVFASLILCVSTFTACAQTHEHAAPDGGAPAMSADDQAAAEKAMAEMAMQMPPPSTEHEWLQQLVGEWKVSSKMSMGPGTEPMTSEGRETISPIGGFWIVCAGASEAPGMGEMHTRMTLGYDPAKGKFLGTWVDSMISHMWIYSGSLDASKKVLTLDAVGPDFFSDPSKSANYRDVITLHDKDHKSLTSSQQQPDGTWMEFSWNDCVRVK